MNTKRIFVIALVLLVIISGALLAYNFIFKKTAAEPAASETPGALPLTPSDRNSGSGSENGGGNASPASLKLKAISKERVVSATLGEDGKTVKYYTRANGNVFESDFDGLELKKTSATTLANLLKAVWSGDKQKVIGIFSENGKTKKYFYDYNTNQSSLLNDKIGYVSWSPDSKKICYQFSESSGRSNISTANPDGTGYKNIFKTRLDNLIIEWPIKEKISLRQPASGLSQNFLYALNSDNGDFVRVLSDIYGLSVKWSPKADKILFSSTDALGKGPHLTLADESGANFKELKLSGIADKCIWSKDDKTIFCALPQQISEYATWPDDYYKGTLIIDDDIYKINLETGEKTKIIGSGESGSFDAQELFLSPKEDYLFFTNRKDGLLWSLKL